jgi:hypothetical protein
MNGALLIDDILNMEADNKQTIRTHSKTHDATALQGLIASACSPAP